MFSSMGRFMQGRYGFDRLTLGLLIASLLIRLIGGFIPGYIGLSVCLVALLLFALSIYRTLSKNTARRQAEYFWVTSKLFSVKDFFTRKKAKVKNRKRYRYYRCPGCKKEVRVPKGKGKIQITCPSCKHQFLKKS